MIMVVCRLDKRTPPSDLDGALKQCDPVSIMTATITYTASIYFCIHVPGQLAAASFRHMTASLEHSLPLRHHK